MRWTAFKVHQIPIAISLLLVGLISKGATGLYVSHFNLVDASRGKAVKRLSDGETVYVDYPFTIEAVLDRPVRSNEDGTVYFVEPEEYTACQAQYYLRGWRSSTFPSESLLPTNMTVSASAGNDYFNRTTISVDIRPKGVAVSGLRGRARVGLAADTVPFSSAGCPVARVPKVELDFVRAPFCGFGCVGYGASVRVDYCEKGNVLLRLMQIRHKTWYPSASDSVIEVSRTETGAQASSTVLTPPENRCGRATLFAEACVRTADGGLKCGTSRFFSLPAEPIDGPFLKWRPPYQLKLALGDRAVLKLAISNNTEGGNDGFRYARAAFENESPPFSQLYAVLRLNYGRRTYVNGPIDGNQIFAPIPPRWWKKGVSYFFNKATVALEFSRPGCDERHSFEGRFATQLIVSNNIASLTVQDKRLPFFETPEYPPTVIGKRVTLRVKARNFGAGLREDGRETRLSYQWYVRTSEMSNTFPRKILGATGPSITLEDARCNRECGSRFGITGLHQYYVDVCNTFGCRRSNVILPNILPPPLKPGQIWEEDTCSIRSESYICESGQIYCVKNGLVKDCSWKTERLLIWVGIRSKQFGESDTVCTCSTGFF